MLNLILPPGPVEACAMFVAGLREIFAIPQTATQRQYYKGHIW
jgi:hypothetical protein